MRQREFISSDLNAAAVYRIKWGCLQVACTKIIKIFFDDVLEIQVEGDIGEIPGIKDMIY